MKQSIVRIGLVGSLIFLFIGIAAVKAQQEGPSVQEILIEVRPGVIALPGGMAGQNIAKVPITSARVRSTEMRDLNKLYNAVSIEKIFAVDQSVGSAGQPTLKSKKKGKLAGKRLLRKTDKGYFESETSPDNKGGKIAADKRLKIIKKQKLKARQDNDVAGGLLAVESGIEEKNIDAVKDMYIISFMDFKGADGDLVSVNLDQAVTDYSALPVVISAKKN